MVKIAVFLCFAMMMGYAVVAEDRIEVSVFPLKIQSFPPNSC